MRIALALLLTGCTTGASLPTSLDDVHPAALVGHWTTDELAKMTLEKSGSATRGWTEGEPEHCGWSMSGDELTLSCASETIVSRVLVNDDELRFGVLEPAAVEDGAWTFVSTVAVTPRVPDKAPDQIYFGATLPYIAQRMAITVDANLASISVKSSRTNGGDCSISSIGDSSCVLGDDDTLACSMLGDLRVAIDRDSGAPQLSGMSLGSTRWVRDHGVD